MSACHYEWLERWLGVGIGLGLCQTSQCVRVSLTFNNYGFVIKNSFWWPLGIAALWNGGPKSGLCVVTVSACNNVAAVVSGWGYARALCQVASNTVWSHMAGDAPWLWDGFPMKNCHLTICSVSVVVHLTAAYTQCCTLTVRIQWRRSPKDHWRVPAGQKTTRVPTVLECTKKTQQSSMMKVPSLTRPAISMCSRLRPRLMAMLYETSSSLPPVCSDT